MAKRSGKHNPWQDHYARKAREDRYPARSVYKLKEMQQKYRLIRPGDRVLDLGCSPGSWLLYAAELVGKKGHVCGIDLKPVTVDLPDHVAVHTGDIDDYLPEDNPGSAEASPIGRSFRVVLSDMAPSTTGNKHVDGARSHRLSQAALSMAKSRLVTGGSFVCKIFQGEDFREFVEQVRSCFNSHKTYKPRSSRKNSREIYVIGMGKRRGLSMGIGR